MNADYLLDSSILLVHQQTRYRLCDSLIVAPTIESGVPALYSEDFQHDRSIGNLSIVNPFL